MKKKYRLRNNELNKFEDWKTLLRYYQSKIKIEEIKFAFEQAEKLLNDSVENSRTIASRATALLTLMAGALVFFFGYIFNQINGKNISHLNTVKIMDFIRFHPILTVVCVITYYLIWVMIKAASNLLGVNYYTSGSQPKDLLVKGYYDSQLTDSERLISYYLGELKDYQFRIMQNSMQNEIRWQKIDSTIWQLIFIIPISGILLILSLFFNVFS